MKWMSVCHQIKINVNKLVEKVLNNFGYCHKFLACQIPAFSHQEQHSMKVTQKVMATC